jgi:membrane-bound metal-dependent hydrolase YbcI (DUF457 family)
MFIGHFAVGFAAKAVAPRASLGTFFLAGQLLDLIWPPLVLLGVEQVRIVPGFTAFTPLEFVSYPYSHSLLLAALWGALLAVGYGLARRDARTALWLGLAVVSHWVLDWISHAPDMPLVPGGARYGLGLWNSVAATLAVEGGLFAVGLALYVAATRPRNRSGGVLLWSLVAVLLLVYLANLFTVPPPGAAAVAGAGLGIWLFVAWGYACDARREAVPRA